MDLKHFMDVLFDEINESDRLAIREIDADYRNFCFYITTQIGKSVRVEFHDAESETVQAP